VKNASFQLSTASAWLASTASAVRVRLTIKKLALAACAAVSVLGCAPASAWTSRGTAYTSRGTYNGAHAGSCGGGSCSHAGGDAAPGAVWLPIPAL
jgi:hypothetical protein